MPTLQERRLAEVTRKIDKALQRREAAIAALFRAESELRVLRLKEKRYKRIAEQPRRAERLPKPKPVDNFTVEKIIIEGDAAAPLTPERLDDGLDIPNYLARKKEGDAKDAEVKAAMLAEQATRKKVKGQGQAETRKARAAGDTRRMPLTGKAALAAIRGA